MVGDVAKRHESVPHPHAFPKLQEKSQGRRPAEVCFVEVQDDIFDAVTVQKFKKVTAVRFNSFVFQFSEVPGDDDDDRLAFLLDLEDSAR